MAFGTEYLRSLPLVGLLRPGIVARHPHVPFCGLPLSAFMALLRQCQGISAGWLDRLVFPHRGDGDPPFSNWTPTAGDGTSVPRVGEKKRSPVVLGIAFFVCRVGELPWILVLRDVDLVGHNRVFFSR